MKHWASILQLSILVLLCGCGGGGYKSGPTSGPPTPTTQGLILTGNWQFSTTSTTGMPPATIAGSITQSDSSVNGAVHVDGSNCFDRLTTIGLTGTLTDSNVSLTSKSVDGQVLTFTFDGNSLTGTYGINGGCAGGDQGNITGVRIPAITADWSVRYEINEQKASGRARLTQENASAEGSFGISGSYGDESPCMSGTITSGTFPTPSFIMGTSVVINIDVDNGTFVFMGTANQFGTEIIGSYTFSSSSSTCVTSGFGKMRLCRGACPTNGLG